MKMSVAVVVAILAHAAGASVKSVGVGFGPKKCVALSRSTAGSCVITTDCEGSDISQTEFAFDCVGQGGDRGIVRHSFGVGGFEASEEFDTDVKCGRCDPPSTITEAKPAGNPAAKKVKVQAILKPVPPPPAAEEAPDAEAEQVPVAPPPPPAAQTKQAPEVIPGVVSMAAGRRSSTETEAKADATASSTAKFLPKWLKPKSQPADMLKPKSQPADMVEYGPKGCVSTYRSKEGHCIIQTDCKGVDISNYEFGVVCVDKKGYPVKHLFGKDSFDEVETFDTLVKCEQCLGMEEIPDETKLFGEVSTMSKDIASLKAVMKNVSINVQMLNKQVFPAVAAAPVPAPAPAPAADAEVEPEAAAMVRLPVTNRRHTDHTSVEYVPVKRNLRHAHRHRHHRRHRHEDDDDDDGAYDVTDESEMKTLSKPEVEYVAWSEFPKKPAAVAVEDDDDDHDGTDFD